MKKLCVMLMCAASVCCWAGQVLFCDKAAENKATFKNNVYPFKPEIVEENGAKFYRVKGRITLISDSKTEIDPEKYYVISVKIRATKNPTFALLGTVSYNEEGKPINHENVIYVKNTFAKLTRPYKSGDKVLYIDKGTTWNLKGAITVAYNVKEDYSDIPCYTLLGGTLQKVTENDNDFEVQLSGGAKVDLPVGTTVRLQRYGGYLYEIVQPLKTTEWTTWTSKPRKGSEFRPQTKTLRPVIICNNGFANESLDFDELKIEEVEAPAK